MEHSLEYENGSMVQTGLGDVEAMVQTGLGDVVMFNCFQNLFRFTSCVSCLRIEGKSPTSCLSIAIKASSKSSQSHKVWEAPHVPNWVHGLC